MGKNIINNKPKPNRNRRPTLSPEARENRCVSMAYDMAEEQLENRTASSQVITHFLKLGTAKAQLELVREQKEIELIKAKADALSSAKRLEGLFDDALNAFKVYSGQGNISRNEDDDYDYED